MNARNLRSRYFSSNWRRRLEPLWSLRGWL